jgi:hypothetical protein
MNAHSKPVPNLVGSIATAVAFLALMAAPIVAQRKSPSESPPMDRYREMRQREAQLRNLEVSAAGNNANKSQVNDIFIRIKQDFERIQIIRNDLVDALAADKFPDSQSISEATTEIKKRASRLKANLPLYRPDGDDKNQKDQVAVNSEPIRNALVLLCDRILSFTTNPIFKSPSIINIKESARASRDLQSIIDLSSGISKSAKEQGRANK